MRTLILSSIAAIALAACSQGEEKTAPEAAAPAATADGTREAVYAAASEGPEPFVRALYAQYVAGGPKGETPAPGQDPIYSRTMNATIGADVRVANGEVPSLNYDLICNCQDQGAFTLDNVTVGQTDPNNATAAVVFTNAGETTGQTLKLVREGPNWKVDDIVRSDGTSTQAETIKVIEAAGG
ncbi:DUF3828 domain-containing protein [Brevundimonas staleyi]|uniref:DUF3828 domain-containing protein n=1 Tax=Brevundimonas staleyi TaxID=74326 RepID=A0ABW0FN18_9CAUL